MISQPQGNNAKPAEIELAPDLAWQAIREAYAGTIAEEVTVRLRPAALGSREHVSRFIVRAQSPVEPVSGKSMPTHLALELESHRVWIADGRFIIEAANFTSVIAVIPYSEPISLGLLAKVLPPLPVPVLVALGPPDDIKQPTPYTPDVRWQSATTQDARGTSAITLTGQARHATVRLVTDPRTGRIRRIESDIKTISGETKCTVECRAVDPGNPADWPIQEAGRDQVDSLNALGEAFERRRASGAYRDFTLMGIDRRGWNPTGALRRLRVEDRITAPVALVLLFRASPDPETFRRIQLDARAGLEAMREISISMRQASPESKGMVVRSAAIIATSDWSPEWPGQLYEWWATMRAPVVQAFDGDDLMWSTSPTQTIDALAPSLNAVIVALPLDRPPLVIPLDGRGSAENKPAIRAELEAAIERAQQP